MKTVVLGDVLVQDNQERKFSEDPQYAVIWVTNLGFPAPLMLTEEELNKALARGMKNPEDVPELGSETSINKFDAE